MIPIDNHSSCGIAPFVQVATIGKTHIMMLRKGFFRLVLPALTVLCGGSALMVPVMPAFADPHDHYHEFREHDVHRFGHRDLELWRAGIWRHEWHNGRLGWWWLAGGVWYFYEKPVYPYPLVVSPMAFVEPVAPVVVAPAAPVVVQPVPAAPPPAAPPAAQAQVWYYCDSPTGYYPYVASCSTPYRPVPARPQ